MTFCLLPLNYFLVIIHKYVIGHCDVWVPIVPVEQYTCYFYLDLGTHYFLLTTQLIFLLLLPLSHPVS